MRRLLAIGFVWFGCAAAWAILGSTLTVRSGSASGELGREVHALWGPALVQAPPSARGQETHRTKQREQKYDEKEKRYFEVVKEVDVTTQRDLPLEVSRLSASLSLEHRRKGLVWFPTYEVAFRGRYIFRNDSGVARSAAVAVPVERGVTYDGFVVEDAAGKPVEVTFGDGSARFARWVAAGDLVEFTVRYKARGTERWTYGTAGGGLGSEQGRARDFELVVDADFAAVDFAAGTLSPSEHRASGGRWRGTWRFEQIVGTAPVGIVLPERLNPGPLAAKLTFFAPVTLLFFFFVTGMLLAARGRSIHPMNYFLLACAFFAFHLLFAYLIDHLAIAPSFALASLVSVALVVTYARLLLGWRTALVQIGLSQLVYLVLFSVTFFWKGYTGLAITVGAILTLFVIMQLTGSIEWERVLGPKTRSETAA